jgi:hypothetical protein
MEMFGKTADEGDAKVLPNPQPTAKVAGLFLAKVSSRNATPLNISMWNLYHIDAPYLQPDQKLDFCAS